MPQVRPVIKIHCAAYHFARISRDINEIAEAFEVSPAAIRKWEKTPEWNETLDTIGYDGDRSFASEPKRNTAREKPEELESARKLYLQLLTDGEPKHRIPRLVSEQTDIKRRTISEWAKRYNWTGEVAE